MSGRCTRTGETATDLLRLRGAEARHAPGAPGHHRQRAWALHRSLASSVEGLCPRASPRDDPLLRTRLRSPPSLRALISIDERTMKVQECRAHPQHAGRSGLCSVERGRQNRRGRRRRSVSDGLADEDELVDWRAPHAGNRANSTTLQFATRPPTGLNGPSPSRFELHPIALTSHTLHIGRLWILWPIRQYHPLSIMADRRRTCRHTGRNDNSASPPSSQR